MRDRLHAIAAGLVKDSPPDDVVFWDDNNTSVFEYVGHRVMMSSIRSMITQMVADLQVMHSGLCAHVDLSQPQFRFPDRISDDYSNDDGGYSFIHDPRNKVDSTAFLEAMLQTGKVLRYYNKSIIFRPLFCDSWTKDYVAMCAQRAALVHMTSGMPPRGTESLETLLVNADRVRSLLHRATGELILKLGYSKNSGVLGGEFPALSLLYSDVWTFSADKDRTILRFIWPGLADLIRFDMAFLRPFAIFLASTRMKMSPATTVNMSRYLNRVFEQDIDTKAITHVMEQYSLDSLGFPIGVSDWRHIATAISRHLLGTDDPDSNDHGEEERAYQEGHSVATERRHYGRELGGMTSNLITIFANHSRAFQKVCAPSPPHA